MKIELHLLQNFPPSCLNRDDRNTPKTCTFGGAKRARISSQCLKRTIRQHESFQSALEGHLGKRTKRLSEATAKLLAERGRNLEEALLRSFAAIDVGGINVDEASLERKPDGRRDPKTGYLLYVGEEEILRLAEAVNAEWDELGKIIAASPSDGAARGKGKKSAAKTDAPSSVKDAIARMKEKGKVADIALFGRMVADKPELGREATCQVAHAISTHPVELEEDFYTAVDDLRSDDTAGSDMMGYIGFDSACFYRYSLVDFDDLKRELGEDADLARRTVRAFAEASFHAIPTGKQNSMAAQCPPDYVRIRVSASGSPINLVNAFEKPLSNGRGSESLVKKSIAALEAYQARVEAMYGRDGGESRRASTWEEHRDMTLPELLDWLDARLSASEGG
jgi:CRISPR system Cascade subunit CasC